MLTVIVLAWIAVMALGISVLAWWYPDTTRLEESSDPIKRSLESLYSGQVSSKRLLES